MQGSFHTKFKDKIRFINKHGWKETIESPNPQQMPVLPRRKPSHKLNTIVGMPSITQNPPPNPQSHQKKLSVLTKLQKRNKTTFLHESSPQEGGYLKPRHLQTLNDSQIDLRPRQDLNDLETSTLSYNPEVESLIIQLRKREREKYKIATAPKYIDQMIIKHQKLLKMIDTKASGKWNYMEELTERKFPIKQPNVHDRSLRKFSSEADTRKSDIPEGRMIAVKRVHEPMDQTKIDDPIAENEVIKWKKSPQFIYASLQNSKVNEKSFRGFEQHQNLSKTHINESKLRQQKQE